VLAHGSARRRWVGAQGRLPQPVALTATPSPPYTPLPPAPPLQVPFDELTPAALLTITCEVC